MKSANKKPKKVVGIGASAGGLNAISELIQHIDPKSGVSYVIVQHLSPDYESHMTELLAKHTVLPIISVNERTPLLPNHIYLNTPKNEVRIQDEFLYPEKVVEDHKLKLPINNFFKELAKAFEHKAVGVVLSGTGSDGSNGIKYIHEKGGTCIAQDPDAADFGGMPISAINTGYVDHILLAPEIGQLLSKLPDIQIAAPVLDQSDAEAVAEFNEILDIIANSSDIDFLKYKTGTIIRRIERRMNTKNIKKLRDYKDFLLKNEKEKSELIRDCLINVTEFFRDRGAWKSIEEKVIPDLFANQKNLRLWVCGCSTGQEAYSLAILLEEYIAKSQKRGLTYKIFATDLDEHALIKAGKGSYSIEELQNLHANYISKYCTLVSSQYVMKELVRSRIVFSKHDILKDPPFVKLDFVSCRNMLIYFQKENQKNVLSKLQFALNKNGYLFLGGSENIGHEETIFDMVDKKWNIHRKKTDRKSATQISWDLNPKMYAKNRYLSENSQSTPMAENFEDAVNRYLGKTFVRDILFIDSEFKVIYMKGRLMSKLTLSEGQFNNNLRNLLNPKTFTILSRGLNAVKSTQESVLLKDVPFPSDHQSVMVDLSIHPVKEMSLADVLYLIQLQGEESPEKLQELEHSDENLTNHIQQLEDQLAEYREKEKYFKEQLDAVNEEVMSTNEELKASNEELQSANEELESLNQELYMVNNELQDKNDQLLNLNNDIRNLLDSSEVGTLFLDNDLNIRLFTPAVKKSFRIEESDIGRSIKSFTSFFSDEIRVKILDYCETALTEIKPSIEELTDQEGKHFLLKVKPYITKKKLIAGVILTFMDISDLKDVQLRLEAQNELFGIANEITQTAVWVWNAKDDVTESFNKYWKEFYDLEPEGSFEQFIQKIHEDERDKVISSIESALENPENPVYLNEFRMFNSRIDDYKWLRNTGLVKFKNGKPERIIGATIDITKNKKLMADLENKTRFFRSITDTYTSGLYIYNIDKGFNTYINKQYTDLLGYSLAEINAFSSEEFMKLFHSDDQLKVQKHMKKVAQNKKNQTIKYRFKKKSGEWAELYSVDSPFEVNDQGEVISFIGSFIDLSGLDNLSEV